MNRSEGDRFVYVRTRTGPVVRTDMFGEEFDVRVDRDGDDRIVGVEFLGALSVTVDGVEV